ncbi:group I truncated hemoglobin [Piscinibacter terrae]|uniref:Group 1 truncated hemoglobin n=1 Tax=Piscinibacter terrae TaxID=2496871 RepID=A0A3N7HV87_9BURK|nr:group 1 truncated hemoglobin [Albitalea terrae]RQP26207.1 group 1 truncated hemoglobin [Albitalea terrae]
MRFIQRLALAVVAAFIVLATPAFAQSAKPVIPADDSLYQQFGGQPGLVKLMDDFMTRLLADPRMNPFFKDVNQQHVKEQLVAQFCELSGGPCKLKGPDMKKVHAGFDIDRSAFNALVEVLQQAMDAQGIPFSAQNRMLAQLAPMHRDIINVP